MEIATHAGFKSLRIIVKVYRLFDDDVSRPNTALHWVFRRGPHQGFMMWEKQEADLSVPATAWNYLKLDLWTWLDILDIFLVSLLLYNHQYQRHHLHLSHLEAGWPPWLSAARKYSRRISKFRSCHFGDHLCARDPGLLIRYRKNTLFDRIVRQVSWTRERPHIEVVDALKPAATGNGGLIIFTGGDPLIDIQETGDQLDAIIAARLVSSFRKPMMEPWSCTIIRSAVRCILPISKSTGLDPELGLSTDPHWISEQSDTLAIVVSEEERGFLGLQR